MWLRGRYSGSDTSLSLSLFVVRLDGMTPGFDAAFLTLGGTYRWTSWLRLVDKLALSPLIMTPNKSPSQPNMITLREAMFRLSD